MLPTELSGKFFSRAWLDAILSTWRASFRYTGQSIVSLHDMSGLPIMFNFTPYTDEYLKWTCTMLCPFCSGFSLKRRFFDALGKPKQFYEPLVHYDFMECPLCLHRWSVYSAFVSEHIYDVAGYSFTSVEETGRSTVPIGFDERIVDHSTTDSKCRKVLKFTHKWSRTLSTDEEINWEIGAEAKFGIDKLSAFKLRAESKLRKKYSIKDETTVTQDEELVIVIPPRRKILFKVHWKKILQHGLVIYESLDFHKINIPFKVTVGLTFDQTQSDIT